MARFAQVLVSFLFLIAAMPSSMAQIGATAQLSGVLTDPAGRAVSNQLISVRSLESGQSRTTRTLAGGRYQVLDLPPGRYEVTVESPGLARTQVPLELTVDQQAVLNLQLQLAVMKQEETVTASPLVIEPTRTELSQVIDERQVRDLPINGRQFLDFVLLTPNVHAGRSNVANPSTPGEPKQVDLSFAGLHESTSLILVDGADNMNRVFGRARSTPSQEAVREFRVLNDSYGANLGPATGGVVSIVTKSGSNHLHGSVYEYFRNNALDARNILAPAGFDELRQNQFGATLGGRMMPGRLFYFANYEGQRRKESPFYSSLLLNNLAAINQAKQSLGLPPEVLLGKLRATNYDTGLGRLDYEASERTQASLSYRFRQDRETNLPAATNQLSAPSNFRNANIDDHALTLNVTSAWTAWLLNQGLFQFAHRSFDFPSVTYEPHLQIANTLDMGRHFNAVNGYQERRFQVVDNLSYAKGSHTLSFGGGLSNAHDRFYYDPFDPSYSVFPNLNAFSGKPPFPGPFAVVFGFAIAPDGTRPAALKDFSAPANIPAYNARVHPENGQTNYALFAQDQWRLTRKLTVNYGLRWDVDHMPARYFRTYYKAFQPRAGIAYSLLNDRIVLRAGAGYYQGQAYAVVYLIAMVAGEDAAFGLVRANEDYAVSTGTLHSPFYSNPALATAALLKFLQTGVYPKLNSNDFSPAQQFISTIKRYNHGGPHSYQWNGQMDIQLSRSTTLSISYLGVKGLELPSAIGGNVAPASLTLANGKADYAIAPGSTVTRTLNPLISPLSFFFDATAQSIYHAGTLSLEKRFSRYYSVAANYTLSKTIDDSGDPSLNGFPEDPYRRYLERANSKQNVPQRFVGTVAAEAPARGWLRDFRVALIASIASANSYTIFAGMDANHDGNANTDRVGTSGRETYRGDRQVNFDLRLARRIRFGEQKSVELIAEGFNIFNTLNVTDINTVYGAPNFIGAIPRSFGDGAPAPLPSFGSIRATDPPRQLQLALRLRF